MEHKSTFEYCPKYENCSAPICPLDEEVNLRVRLADEEICVYCRKRKKDGTRYRMPEELKSFVPVNNLKMLKK
jgi:hypothetical protein